MTTYDNLQLLVHLDDEEGQGLVALGLTPAQEDLPQLLSVDGVITLRRSMRAA